MKVLFLNIGLFDANLNILKRIVDETGAKIVFISSWRSYPEVVDMANSKLKKFDIVEGECAPRIRYSDRILEDGGIEAYLSLNNDIDTFVILNHIDQITGDVLYLIRDKYNDVIVDTEFHICDSDADKVIKILNKGE